MGFGAVSSWPLLTGAGGASRDCSAQPTTNRRQHAAAVRKVMPIVFLKFALDAMEGYAEASQTDSTGGKVEARCDRSGARAATADLNERESREAKGGARLVGAPSRSTPANRRMDKWQRFIGAICSTPLRVRSEPDFSEEPMTRRRSSSRSRCRRLHRKAAGSSFGRATGWCFGMISGAGNRIVAEVSEAQRFWAPARGEAPPRMDFQRRVSRRR